MEPLVQSNIARTYNSSDLDDCTKLLILTKEQEAVKNVFQIISPILCMLGIVGNTMGLIVAFKEKHYPMAILTRAFYGVNMINCVIMILYPIMDLMGEFNRHQFWLGNSWQHYISDYHFPIAKALINQSLGIYVIFSLSQMIAISFPYFYRKYFTTSKIAILILTYYVYVQIWYYPTRYWFIVLRIENACGFDPNLTIYVRKLHKYKKTAWMIYAILRECFTKIIPILSVIVFKLCLLKKKRKILQRIKNRGNLGVTTKPSKRSESIVKSNKLSSNILKPRICDRDNAKNGDETKLSKRQSSHDTSKFTQKRRDYNMNIRMLAIILIQCILFLLPATIFVISVYSYEFLMLKNMELTFGICTFLEYLYISQTFYLNLIFNPEYRFKVQIIRKDFMGKINGYNENKLSII
ncbi:unnamed protein product [Gordionus sp. m RMFG-2023]